MTRQPLRGVQRYRRTLDRDHLPGRAYQGSLSSLDDRAVASFPSTAADVVTPPPA